jgi:hypothetical protein
VEITWKTGNILMDSQNGNDSLWEVLGDASERLNRRVRRGIAEDGEKNAHAANPDEMDAVDVLPQRTQRFRQEREEEVLTTEGTKVHEGKSKEEREEEVLATKGTKGHEGGMVLLQMRQRIRNPPGFKTTISRSRLARRAGAEQQATSMSGR